MHCRFHRHGRWAHRAGDAINIIGSSFVVHAIFISVNVFVVSCFGVIGFFRLFRVSRILRQPSKIHLLCQIMTVHCSFLSFRFVAPLLFFY
jgi:hypothetical protein